MKRTRFLPLFLACSLALTLLTTPALGVEADLQTAADQAANLAGQYGVATSVQYAVWQDGEITLTGHSGVYSKTENRALTDDILYGVGSVSKVYTTAIVLKLTEEGKLDLDKPVTAYLPAFRMADPRYKDITVRMLLNHSSGLMGSSTVDAFLLNDPQETIATDGLLARLSTQTLKADPGAFSVYCNDGFTLAQLVAEAVSGIPFEDYLPALLTPMGLSNTFTPADDFDRARLAKTYTTPEDVRPLPTESVGVVGTGGIYATAADLAAFGGQLYASGVLGKASLDAMAAPEYAKGIWPQDVEDSLAYGLGWDSVQAYPFAYSGVQALTKGGDTLSYHASLLVLPEQKLSVAVLSSGGSSVYNGGAAARIALDVLQQGGVTVDEAPKTLAPAAPAAMPKALAAYAGHYTSTALPCTIAVTEDGTLTLRTVYGQQSFTYRADGTFRDEKNTEALTLVKEENGSIYLAQKAYTDLTGLVQIPSSSYLYQRVPENPVTQEIQDAWNARIGTFYLMLNEKYTSQLYALTLPMAGLADSDSAPGYLAFCRLLDADHTIGVAAIPGTAGRDWQNLSMSRDANGVEYMEVMGGRYQDVVSLTPIHGGAGICTIQDGGDARWYLVGESAGKTLTVTVPEHGAFYVYDAQGKPVAGSWAYGDSAAVLPEGGFIVFAGDPGVPFQVDIA